MKIGEKEETTHTKPRWLNAEESTNFGKGKKLGEFTLLKRDTVLCRIITMTVTNKTKIVSEAPPLIYC